MSCVHCARLREERDEAIEAARQLRALLTETEQPFLPPARWRLTPSGRNLLQLFLARPLVTRAAAVAVLVSHADACADPHVAAVQICHLRRRLRAAGLDVSLAAVRGLGWMLTAAEKQTILAAFDESEERARRGGPAPQQGRAA